MHATIYANIRICIYVIMNNSTYTNIRTFKSTQT